jgi:hypothetical protein
MTTHAEKLANAFMADEQDQRWGVPLDRVSIHDVAPHPLEKLGRPLTHEEQDKVRQYRQSSHEGPGRGHRDEITTVIVDALEKMKSRQAMVITLIFGIGDPETPDEEITYHLMTKGRVREVDDVTGELLSELIPMKIYCFRKHTEYAIQVAHLQETDGNDIQVFSGIFPTNPREDKNTTFRSVLNYVGQLTTTVMELDHGQTTIAKCLWKAVVIDLMSSTRNLNFADVIDPADRAALKAAQIDAPAILRSVIKMKKGEGGTIQNIPVTVIQIK